MKSYKDMRTMAFKMALLLSAAAAYAATDSALVERQGKTMDRLDSLDASIFGLRLAGTARSGVLTSSVRSDQLADGPTRENQAYSDVNLVLHARPGYETEARVELRLHKDWQSAYSEGINPVIGHWFSYDGSILGKHLDFNLGYMRVGYTPLTIETTQPRVLQEPAIFAEKRIEALAQRNLDTSSRRLMTGLNADYHSGQWGLLDDVHLQATGARMRNTPKKEDQLFFDFDYSDRYMGGWRAGASAYGLTVSGNYVNTFDRRLSTRSRPVGDSLYYEDNRVQTLGLDYSSVKLLPELPMEFGVQAEYARSGWTLSQDKTVAVLTPYYELKEVTFPDAYGDEYTTAYVSSTHLPKQETVFQELASEKGNALLLRPYVKGLAGELEYSVQGVYMDNDEDFWSEQASSPAYMGNTAILNSDANYSGVDSTLLGQFRSGNLENLYFSIYESKALTSQTLMGSTKKALSSPATENGRSALYNNYKTGHFYRNGYTAVTSKRLEAAGQFDEMDPSVNMALPYGFATPDRSGFSASADLLWMDAVSLNGRFGSYEAAFADNQYSQIAGGAAVDIAELMDLSSVLKVQGSVELSSEDKGLKRETQRITLGADVGVWGPVSLLLGAQMLEKTFGEGLVVDAAGTVEVEKVEESLLLAGPRVRLAPGAYLDIQGGLLGNEISYAVSGAPAKLSLDKNLLMADITVAF